MRANRKPSAAIGGFRNHRGEQVAPALSHVPACMRALRCDLGRIDIRVFTQPGDVLGWRTPEETAVFSAEL
jgi:hypothetical protein